MYEMKSKRKIYCEFANELMEHMALKIINTFKQKPVSCFFISDHTDINNLWDEYCLQCLDNSLDYFYANYGKLLLSKLIENLNEYELKICWITIKNKNNDYRLKKNIKNIYYPDEICNYIWDCLIWQHAIYDDNIAINKIVDSLEDDCIDGYDILKIKNKFFINDKLGEKICNNVIETVIDDLRNMDGDLLSGDDSCLENIYNEICVQMQVEESIYWNTYMTTCTDMIECTIDEMKRYELMSMWMLTSEADSIIEENPDLPFYTNGYDLDDITQYLLNLLLEKASYENNEAIETYINHLNGFYENDEDD